jgi:hypothetical protein
MEVEIHWSQPISLRSLSPKDIDRVRELLTSEPGVYAFARRWGGGFEVLYVGQARKMSVRVTQQLNNHKLIEHIRNSKTGARVILTGYLTYQGYTNIKKHLDIAERAYIRYCISEGHSLHNKLGTRLRTDDVMSEGGSTKSAFPAKIRIESKG